MTFDLPDEFITLVLSKKIYLTNIGVSYYKKVILQIVSGKMQN